MDIFGFLIYFIIVVTSLTVHEFAHGYTAWLKGDRTAKADGRLSLNPIRHLDPLGTLVFILTALHFRMPVGWAKPVPVNPMNLDNPKRDMVLVAFAGPLSNMVFAFLCGYLFILLPINEKSIIGLFLILFTQVNLGLAIFNLIPIPPLDGSNIVKGLLPHDKIMSYVRFTAYLPHILIGLMIFSMYKQKPILSYVFSPIIEPWFYLWRDIIFQGKVPFL